MPSIPNDKSDIMPFGESQPLDNIRRLRHIDRKIDVVSECTRLLFRGEGVAALISVKRSHYRRGRNVAEVSRSDIVVDQVRFFGIVLLLLRPQPVSLQLLADGGIVVRIMARGCQRNCSYQSTIDRAIELSPGSCRRPASIAWKTATSGGL